MMKVTTKVTATVHVTGHDADMLKNEATRHDYIPRLIFECFGVAPGLARPTSEGINSDRTGVVWRGFLLRYEAGEHKATDFRIEFLW